LSIEEYWNLNPKQFEKCIEVYIHNKKQQAMEIDAHNYNLGRYVSIGVNNPRKYPNKPLLQKEERSRGRMSVEEMQAVAQRITDKLSNKVNDGD
jgi:hypothetical protein